MGAHVLFLALDFMTDPLFVETLERLFFLLAWLTFKFGQNNGLRGVTDLWHKTAGLLELLLFILEF